MNAKSKKLLDCVYQDIKPAIGCTEPVAVAFAGSVCKKYVTGAIQNISLSMSKNIYKNGKSVIVPHTNGKAGLSLAFCLGLLFGNHEKKLLLLSDITPEELDYTLHFMEEHDISESIAPDAPNIFIDCKVLTDKETIHVTISHAHTNVVWIQVNEEILFQKNICDTSSNEEDDFIASLSFDEIIELTNSLEDSELEELQKGIALNMNAFQEALTNSYGLNVGKTLKKLQEKNILGNDITTTVRIATMAAADMRMGGGNLAIMTSGGSGNQGIGVFLPIYLTAEKENVEENAMLHALFLAHAINKYVKIYSGKLSGMCGCAIGAGIGVCAGISYMLGGNKTQIKGACDNLFANLTGMICDGAKDTCSLKLGSSTTEAVISAYLALNDIIVHPKTGIIGNSIEETIKNVGALCHKGFTQADDVLIDIIK